MSNVTTLKNSSDKPTPKPVERDGKGMRDALFDEMDSLRSGRGNPARALAMAKLAAQISTSVRLELDYQRYLELVEQEGGKFSASLGTLVLGSPK